MSKLKTMYVSQRYNYSQFFDSLSTSDNTFHIYEICLNQIPIMGIRSHSQNDALM